MMSAGVLGEPQSLVWRHPGRAGESECAEGAAAGYQTVRRGSRREEEPTGGEETPLKLVSEQRGSGEAVRFPREAQQEMLQVESRGVPLTPGGSNKQERALESEADWMKAPDCLQYSEDSEGSARGGKTMYRGDRTTTLPLSESALPDVQLSVSFLESVPSVVPEELQPATADLLAKEVVVSGTSDVGSSAVSEDSPNAPGSTEGLLAAPAGRPERGATLASSHVTFSTPGSRPRTARPPPPRRQSSLLSGARVRHPVTEHEVKARTPGAAHVGADTPAGRRASRPHPCEEPLLAGVGSSTLALRTSRDNYALSLLSRSVAAAGPLSASSSGDSGVCSVSAQRLVVHTRPAAPSERLCDRDCDCDCDHCDGGRTPAAPQSAPVAVPAVVVLTLAVGYLCLGGAAISWWEDWRFQDGVFFCCVTLLTIGFGEPPPGTRAEHPELLLLFCSAYLTLGLMVVAMCFSLVQEQLVDRCRRLGRRAGLTGDGRRHGRHRRRV